jgi:hypothetical protein
MASSAQHKQSSQSLKFGYFVLTEPKVWLFRRFAANLIQKSIGPLCVTLLDENSEAESLLEAEAPETGQHTRALVGEVAQCSGLKKLKLSLFHLR